MTQLGMVPRSIDQALRDRSLSPTARLTMYVLADLLTFDEWREVKSTALASLLGCEDQTAGRALRVLVERGYLDQRSGAGRARLFRLLWSRRTLRTAA